MAAAMKGAMTLMFVLAVFAAISVSVSAQEPVSAPAPAPSMDKGAAYSMGVSGAVICSSLFLSMLAFFKH